MLLQRVATRVTCYCSSVRPSVRHSVRLQLGSVGMAAVTGAQNIDLSQANDPSSRL